MLLIEDSRYNLIIKLMASVPELESKNLFLE